MFFVIHQILNDEIAGDPCTGVRWSRRSTQSVATSLETYDIFVSDRTVSRLMKQDGFKLRVNAKQLPTVNHPDRDLQFQYIQEFRTRAEQPGILLLSVDAKSKIRLGLFRNIGVHWATDPTLVFDHDFPSLSIGTARPYGIYDIHANKGAFFVGCSHDTPEFAADNLVRWWKQIGQFEYPHTKEICILADSGGSNGYRPRAWKFFLQHRLANVFNLVVSVAHFPSGCSKWNPIEHRLHSEISKNWAGIPLINMPTVVNLIRGTTTETGLKVTADIIDKSYKTGVKILPEQMDELNIVHGSICPQWNYTIKPQLVHTCGTVM